MFQPGELLVYGSTGVCQVLSIDQRQDYVNGVKQSRLYYQLKPLYQGGVIYTPVDNDKVVMRPVISREDAETLIDSIPTLRPAVCPADTALPDQSPAAQLPQPHGADHVHSPEAAQSGSAEPPSGHGGRAVYEAGGAVALR